VNGEIEVFEEHLYTEQVQNQLRSAIHAFGNCAYASPRVLLTTIKDEEHVLGLLLVEALLAHAWGRIASRSAPGPRSADIAAAARATGAEIVALSFSGACPWRKARDSPGRAARDACRPPSRSGPAAPASPAGHARKLAGVQVISAWRALPPADGMARRRLPSVAGAGT
jgi:hypothetical protein